MLPEHTLDPSVRRSDGGRVLIGGSPLRVLRLSAAGAAVVDLLAHGRPLPDRPSVARLLDRLVEGGLAHPHRTSGPFGPGDVTLVVPARDRLPRVVDAALVVDDGSDPPLALPGAGAVVRRPAPGGPAAARNTGWRRASTPLVAFVDADVAPQGDWLTPLLPHFADPRVAAVAPRVRSEPGPGWLAGADEALSPLDLGPLAARVAPLTRVAYVPGAALVVRRAALEDVGGFDEALRVGEDVDLVWRLVAGGHRVRYEPAATVLHEPRRGLAAWARQRFDYGTSAAPLARRHPGALAPVAVSGWSLAAWALLAAKRPVTGLAVAGATTALLARKLHALEHPGREAMRLGLVGHLSAGRALAQAVTRAWLPLAGVAALRSPTARRALAASVVVRGRPPLRLLDDAAYGAGVWTGCWRERTLAPLRPALGSWPGRTPVPEPG
jgi:mycofactocin system glycosyltransferase